MPTPEDHARETIDDLLIKAGWVIQDANQVNLSAARGIVIRNFPLVSGHGFADYLFYIDGKAAGVIEAKREGATLTGVEIQSAKYSGGCSPSLPVYIRPLPFLYQSTGVETRFTNELDPKPRSRPTFSFHKPETLAKWLEEARLEEVRSVPTDKAAFKEDIYKAFPTLRKRLQQLPPLREEGLWPAQKTAIRNLEHSLAHDRPRALIQMATGSGKTFTAITAIYRLIKFAGARRVLFLVDRGNLGDQTLKEFQQYVSPYNNWVFTEEFIVQRLSSNTLDTTARVCISTIQRMFSMLKGKELADEDDEISAAGLESLFKQPEPIEFNPAIPIETFDVIITDECHRSIYNLWSQVLTYFDAYLIGLTATPNKQTFGFFHQNLVMEYPHEQAVADGVNVNYDVYRIRTAISEAGSTVDAGFYVEKRERETRKTQSFRREAAHHMTGAVGQKRVPLSFLEEALIPVPLFDDQKRIVAEIEKQFSRLDQAVANLKRVKANLKRYKAAVLKAAVEGKLTEKWRKAHPDVESASKLLERILTERRAKWKGKGKYKEPAKPGTSNLPSLPTYWIWTIFEQISLRVTVGHVGPMKHEYVPKGIPFLRSQNVRENKFDPEGLLFIRPEFHAKLSKSVIRGGDLAVVRSGSVGVTCVIPEALGEANCADLVLIQSPIGLAPEFGAYYMNSLAKGRVEAGKVGVALTHFNTKSVALMPVPLPPFKEQEQIVGEVERRLSVIEGLEAATHANLTRANNLRQSVLRRAFSGSFWQKR